MVACHHRPSSPTSIALPHARCPAPANSRTPPRRTTGEQGQERVARPQPLHGDAEGASGTTSTRRSCSCSPRWSNGFECTKHHVSASFQNTQCKPSNSFWYDQPASPASAACTSERHSQRKGQAQSWHAFEVLHHSNEGWHTFRWCGWPWSP